MARLRIFLVGLVVLGVGVVCGVLLVVGCNSSTPASGGPPPRDPTGTTGFWVKLDEHTVSSATTSIDFTAISSSYRLLQILLYGQSTTSDGFIQITFNDDSGTNYAQEVLVAKGNTATASTSTNPLFGYFDFDANTEFFGQLLLTNIASRAKSVQGSFSGIRTNGQRIDLSGLWNNTSVAINKISLSLAFGGVFTNGTTAILFGGT